MLTNCGLCGPQKKRTSRVSFASWQLTSRMTLTNDWEGIPWLLPHQQLALPIAVCLLQIH